MKPSDKVIVISAARFRRCDLLTITAGRTSVDIAVNRATQRTHRSGVVAIDSVHPFGRITGAEHDDPGCHEQESGAKGEHRADTKIPMDENHTV